LVVAFLVLFFHHFFMSTQNVTSIAIDKNHYLISLGLPTDYTSRPLESVSVNHIFAIDCSGSMYGELGKIRQQIKNKLSMLVKENDTVSIIWFSGRGQCGVIVEGLQIKTNEGLLQLQKAVDRYLQTVGLTGFVEPLQTAQQVVDRVTKDKQITSHSLLFLTDGHDNCSNVDQIINAVKPLGKSLSSAVFVEYGYYCNRNLLTKMAENCGGKLIFSEDFADFEPNFEEFVTKQQSGAKKKKVVLPSKAKYDVAFTNDDQNGVMTYAVDADNSILIEADVDAVYYHAEEPVILIPFTSPHLFGGTIITSVESLQHTTVSLPSLYASLYVLSQRMKSNEVYSTLNFLGDVDFVDAFSNAFGKQNLYAFQRKALAVAQGEEMPYSKGQLANYVPAADAYCLLNLFDDLMAEEGNLFLSNHPEFEYKSIGAKKVAAVSKDEVNAEIELNLLLEEYSNLTTADKDEKSNLLVRIGDAAVALQKAGVAEPAKFEQEPSLGTAMTDFVWNESRPNLSIRVRQTGKVILPANEYGLTEVPSFRYRNYTLIKDGIVNVKKLPVQLSPQTFAKIRTNAPQILNIKDEQVSVLDLTKLPIVNRQMVLDVSAKQLAELQFNLTSAKAAQSVFNYFQKEHFPKVSEAFAKEYSEEAAAWLKEQGVTDYNGFAPRTTEEKIGESYMSTELNVELEGMKSMPAAKGTWDKYQAGKALTNREEIMREGLREYSDFINSAFYTGASDSAKTGMLKSWLLDKQKQVVAKVREYQNEIAQIKFAIILGQVWFREFKSLDENRIEIEVNGKPISCTILLENKEV
jgi:hypothetical protein